MHMHIHNHTYMMKLAYKLEISPSLTRAFANDSVLNILEFLHLLSQLILGLLELAHNLEHLRILTCIRSTRQKLIKFLLLVVASMIRTYVLEGSLITLQSRTSF